MGSAGPLQNGARTTPRLCCPPHLAEGRQMETTLLRGQAQHVTNKAIVTSQRTFFPGQYKFTVTAPSQIDQEQFI